ncbi:uncharacterized protein, partial [Clytia hemisphaerica]|uniref:uncharacterized protein n=1 Tax=Clytia hemisphaerica TaxID=252671 RepID=UPI0034D50AEF
MFPLLATCVTSGTIRTAAAWGTKKSPRSAITNNSEYLPSTYTATREDRDDGYGGVIIIRKKELKIEEIRVQSSDIVAIKVITYEKPVLVCACYRSPSNKKEDNKVIINKLNDLLKKHKNNPIWLAGDFNLPDIDWNSNSIVGNANSDQLNEDFLQLFDQHKMSQHINFNTRKEALLDLLLTNRPTFLVRCLPVAGFGDHDTCAIADIVCHPQKFKPVQRTVYCWNRANIQNLRQDIDTNIKNLVASTTPDTSVNDIWINLKDILLTAQATHVPTKITSQRFQQPWFNRACKKAVRKKKRSYRKYKVSKDPTDWKYYIKCEKEPNKTCEKTTAYYLNQGPKGSNIKDIVFTRNGIHKLLSNINPKKACGPDNVSARILH